MNIDNKVIGAVFVIAILIVGGYLFLGSNTAVVSATGESVLEVTPDKVSVNLNVEGKGKTAQDAKAVHDKIVDEVVIQLLRAGLERKQIKTVNYNIYPEYDWRDGGRNQTGFLAQEQIVVETEDFDKVAEIVDASVAGGALVSWINFELSEEKQSDYKAQALEEAGKDAKKKAEATAKGLGKSVGSLVSVQSEEFNYGPYRYFEASGAGDVAEAKTAAVNIAPRDIEVRATLRVEYKLSRF